MQRPLDDTNEGGSNVVFLMSLLELNCFMGELKITYCRFGVGYVAQVAVLLALR